MVVQVVIIKSNCLIMHIQYIPSGIVQTDMKEILE